MKLVAWDIVVWLCLHIGVSWFFIHLPNTWFSLHIWWFRPKKWELPPSVYETYLHIKTWKGKIPDAGPYLGLHFSKKKLHSRHPPYIRAFIQETCRAECVHMVTGCFSLIFFIWHTAPVGWLMVGYGIASNMPCILIQRYNRIRLIQLLEHNLDRQ